MATLINGLGGPAGFGEEVLPPNDDGSSMAIDLREAFDLSGVDFFGNFYTQLFVNNNGNITFGGPTSRFIPDIIGAGLSLPIIAALWMDLDTRGDADPSLPGLQGELSPGGNSTGSNLVYYDIDRANSILTVTWDDVGFFSLGTTPNAFQIRLHFLDDGDFDIEFFYESINAVEPGVARAGYSSGDPASGDEGDDEGGSFGSFSTSEAGPSFVSYELPGSGDVAAMLALETTPGNTGVPGYWRFEVRAGIVSPDPTDDPSDGPVLPPPDQGFAIFGGGPVQEGDESGANLSFVVQRTGNLSESAIANWELVDFLASDLAASQPRSGQVVFEPGSEAATFTVVVLGDRIPEEDRTVSARLVATSAGPRSFDSGRTATVAILDDDLPSQFTFAGPVSRQEGDTGETTVGVRVVRTGDLTQAATVDWQLEFVGADAGDLSLSQLSRGSLDFAVNAGEATISVRIAGDVTVEPDERLVVRLTGASVGSFRTALSATTDITIINDDLKSRIALGGDVEIAEGGHGAESVAVVVVVRTGDLSESATVTWRLDLGAADRSDFGDGQALTGQVSFAPGQERGRIEVAVAGDNRPEPDESFAVILTSVSAGGVTRPLDLTAAGLIRNDDAAPTFAFTGAQAVAEGSGSGNLVEFLVVRSGSLETASQVVWRLEGVTAGLADFAAGQPVTGVLEFAPGQSQAVIPVLTAGDRVPEADETFSVSLTTATTGDLTSALSVSARGVIGDDDSVSALLVAAPSTLTLPEGDLGPQAFTFTVMRIGDVSAAATLNYRLDLSAGSATAGDFASPLSGAATFASGVAFTSVTVMVRGDTEAEVTESFAVEIFGDGFAAARVVGMILNDDAGQAPARAILVEEGLVDVGLIGISWTAAQTTWPLA